MLTDETDQEAYSILKNNITQKIHQDVTIYEYDQILENELPEGVEIQKTLYPYYGGGKDSLTAEDLDLDGVVADIHTPTLAYGVSELIRIGEIHQEDSDEPDEETDHPVEIRVKIGDQLQEFSSILHIDSDFFQKERPCLDA
ncbi:hypothetical protein HZS55_14445 [Halosimplex rubrum]|uniref:Uncharacterized protein n=1 Tax=Halosimplex rubrum TaxID=869889 RepID=A0A7D5P6C8_9EURY|nr:hypothetical protein [Halosimplex rubrum]QLH78422.1 hypothetical protein HZS55_14445 [Halosimplex rubrum]